MEEVNDEFSAAEKWILAKILMSYQNASKSLSTFDRLKSEFPGKLKTLFASLLSLSKKELIHSPTNIFLPTKKCLTKYHIKFVMREIFDGGPIKWMIQLKQNKTEDEF